MRVTFPSFVEIALRTAVIYLIIILKSLRLTGKREVGQMMPLELAMLILVVNAVQNATRTSRGHVHA
ncbi:MAG: hypothetical protein ONB48_11880 [candidate division KSB1 bacterium]|nr:hypothetical protein [candidate division KSB1 bacterium]MDZ7273970.1 hypothetical protein [candidate division KSB1 bacterium]MDZ7286343.1 hypothetical protein [candidate division KSB1 bacterium]MDZ7296571.1 hypothetical protein [candidate division KSB1 bacterium]MDZ7306104.1 hypothetical protein [candidate division KSB1 bacterium]